MTSSRLVSKLVYYQLQQYKIHRFCGLNFCSYFGLTKNKMQCSLYKMERFCENLFKI